MAGYLTDCMYCGEEHLVDELYNHVRRRHKYSNRYFHVRNKGQSAELPDGHTFCAPCGLAIQDELVQLHEQTKHHRDKTSNPVVPGLGGAPDAPAPEPALPAAPPAAPPAVPPAAPSTRRPARRASW
jgi:hypothetical protein